MARRSSVRGTLGRPPPQLTTSDTIAAVLGWSVVGLLVVAAFLGLVMLRFWLVAREDPSIAVDGAPTLDLQALSAAVAADASERRAALSAGSPTQGIIAPGPTWRARSSRPACRCRRPARPRRPASTLRVRPPGGLPHGVQGRRGGRGAI